MVTGEGIYLDVNQYKDLGDNEVVTTEQLDHSEYGMIDYVVYDGSNIAVSFESTDPDTDVVPVDWEDELV